MKFYKILLTVLVFEVQIIALPIIKEATFYHSLFFFSHNLIVSFRDKYTKNDAFIVYPFDKENFYIDGIWAILSTNLIYDVKRLVIFYSYRELFAFYVFDDKYIDIIDFHVEFVKKYICYRKIFMEAKNYNHQKIILNHFLVECNKYINLGFNHENFKKDLRFYSFNFIDHKYSANLIYQPKDHLVTLGEIEDKYVEYISAIEFIINFDLADHEKYRYGFQIGGNHRKQFLCSLYSEYRLNYYINAIEISFDFFTKIITLRAISNLSLKRLRGCVAINFCSNSYKCKVSCGIKYTPSFKYKKFNFLSLYVNTIL